VDRDRHDPVIESRLLRPAMPINLERESFMKVADENAQKFRDQLVRDGLVEKTLLPTDAKARKDTPVVTGVLDYFPLAIAYVAHVSKVGNAQHNPGQPLHWAKGKSTDHADSLVRHLMERGKTDSDGVLHSGKVAWRALALLQTELEN
jgi:hypothetical protein